MYLQNLNAKIIPDENLDKNLNQLKYNWQITVRKKAKLEYYENLEINKIKNHLNLEKNISCRIEFNSFSVVINKKQLEEERIWLVCNVEGVEVRLDNIACYDVILDNERYKSNKGGMIFPNSEVRILCYSKK